MDEDGDFCDDYLATFKTYAEAEKAAKRQSVHSREDCNIYQVIAVAKAVIPPVQITKLS